MPGLNVMVFHDYYPEGHQGGVGIIQNGERIATNGVLRLESTPGQWQPLPKMDDKKVYEDDQRIAVSLHFPDSSRHRQGFNPMIYPGLQLNYKVEVEAEGQTFRVRVHLNQPLSPEWAGKVGFNLELFPGLLFGNSYISKPGMYMITYGNDQTHAFEISEDIFKRGAWQPTLEYYLPVQMCHMRVNEKYRFI